MLTFLSPLFSLGVYVCMCWHMCVCGEPIWSFKKNTEGNTARERRGQKMEASNDEVTWREVRSFQMGLYTHIHSHQPHCPRPYSTYTIQSRILLHHAVFSLCGLKPAELTKAKAQGLLVSASTENSLTVSDAAKEHTFSANFWITLGLIKVWTGAHEIVEIYSEILKRRIQYTPPSQNSCLVNSVYVINISTHFVSTKSELYPLHFKSYDTNNVTVLAGSNAVLEVCVVGWYTDEAWRWQREKTSKPERHSADLCRMNVVFTN